VRACLAAGDVEQAARLLGRPHRLVLDASQAYASDGASGGETATYPTRAALNQYPAVGTYEGVLPVPEETPDAKPVRVTVRVTETEVAVTAPSAADLAAFAGGVDLTARAR
jgi:FAD synthase